MAAAGGPEATGRCPLLSLLLLLLLAGPALGWKDPDRILLRDVKALTLHHDRYTTSRRLDPIPQLKCVGGTAGCDSYTPKVIQCQNKGWDGYDVQWECKTDLDIAYKFGKTVVSCEGYESSEDQYILRGSCGLEYNLDYTELGLKKLRESGKNHGFSSFSDYYNKLYSPDSSGISGLITIVVLLAIAFGVYKVFLSDGQDSPPPYSEYPPNSHRYQRFTNSAGPPPAGFKSEFTEQQHPSQTRGTTRLLRTPAHGTAVRTHPFVEPQVAIRHIQAQRQEPEQHQDMVVPEDDKRVES
ncbi:store-operated calcium entry-associated regulatory factor isoform X2 [Mustela putorius furo]|uniref:Store-operated calcium entry-associated regulatory factor n=1 Tax=Mustela putorius furo TaxID=9669 RepID=A0A8U0RLE9_MUSPF|nr:store-operated calcium entry-associated regulatory factor isoform X2 [Mustela putorius furo]